jgi:cytochrome P450
MTPTVSSAPCATAARSTFVQLPQGGRVWLVVGYQEALDALNDPSLSKDWMRATGQLGPNVIGANMITSDPPNTPGSAGWLPGSSPPAASRPLSPA